MNSPLKTKSKTLQLTPKAKSKTSPSPRYDLYISSNEILILNKSDNQNLLLIDRKSLASGFIPLSELSSYKTENPLPIFGIFGKIEINNITFIIAISKARVAATLRKSQILKIESVKFLTVQREHYKNFDYESCWDRLERTKHFLKTGFYFSYTYRLQSDFEGRFEFPPRALMAGAKANPFVWNYKAIRALAANRALRAERRAGEEVFDGEAGDFAHFFVPFIQGFVGAISAGEFQMVLISRRSMVMGGTRYNSRGCDNAGNVANFVQSEQLVILEGRVFSFNQIRGSLPFYWEQPRGLINPKAIIHQRQEINADLIQRHIKILLEPRYERLVFFNLLSRKRPEEDSLSRYLVLLLESAMATGEFKDKIRYEHVDFHAITKTADFSQVDKYIYGLYNLNNSNLNIFESDGGEKNFVQICKQTSIIRTNCLDCLDRTNAVQTKFGFYALYKILQTIGSDLLAHFSEKTAEEPLTTFEKCAENFFQICRKLWADNGDFISKIYTGTGATTSSVTRKGKQSTFTSFIDHKMKTITRFYNNNFDDTFKQEIIDVLLHKKSSSIRPSDNLLRELQPELFNNIKVSFVTFFSCVKNGNLSISELTLESIFKNNKGADVIIFITRVDKPKPIQLISENPITCDSFNELFKTLYKQLNGFKLVEQTEASRFEISIFALETKPNLLTFFKSEKASISSLGPSLGLRTSFIINNNGIELFSLKLEQTTFGYTPSKSLEKVFGKYIDKDYDLVLIAGYIEDSELELETLNKNYELALQEVTKGVKDGKFASHLILYCSKNVVLMETQPSYAPLYVDRSGLSEELTINAHSFLVNSPK